VTTEVLTDSHGTLLQGHKLLLLLFNQAHRDMVSFEGSLELFPGNSVWVLMSKTIRFPLVLCGSLQLPRATQDLLCVIALSNDQLLLFGLEPILNLHGVSWVRKNGGANVLLPPWFWFWFWFWFSFWFWFYFILLSIWAIPCINYVYMVINCSTVIGWYIGGALALVPL